MGDVAEKRPPLCRTGLHHLQDSPDPNPENRGLEQRGYRACTRCSAESGPKVYPKVYLSGRRR